MSETARPLLLVEDDPVYVELLRRAYEKRARPCPLQIARDGEAVIAQVPLWEAGAPAPRLIVLDVGLPRLNGLEVLRRLKAHHRFRLIPIVMLTASNDPDDMRRAYALGANSYLIKPAHFTCYEALAEMLDTYWLGLNQFPEN